MVTMHLLEDRWQQMLHLKKKIRRKGRQLKGYKTNARQRLSLVKGIRRDLLVKLRTLIDDKMRKRKTAAKFSMGRALKLCRTWLKNWLKDEKFQKKRLFQLHNEDKQLNRKLFQLGNKVRRLDNHQQLINECFRNVKNKLAKQNIDEEMWKPCRNEVDRIFNNKAARSGVSKMHQNVKSKSKSNYIDLSYLGKAKRKLEKLRREREANRANKMAEFAKDADKTENNVKSNKFFGPIQKRITERWKSKEPEEKLDKRKHTNLISKSVGSTSSVSDVKNSRVKRLKQHKLKESNPFGPKEKLSEKRATSYAGPEQKRKAASFFLPYQPSEISVPVDNKRLLQWMKRQSENEILRPFGEQQDSSSDIGVPYHDSHESIYQKKSRIKRLSKHLDAEESTSVDSHAKHIGQHTVEDESSSVVGRKLNTNQRPKRPKKQQQKIKESGPGDNGKKPLNNLIQQYLGPKGPMQIGGGDGHFKQLTQHKESADETTSLIQEMIRPEKRSNKFHRSRKAITKPFIKRLKAAKKLTIDDVMNIKNELTPMAKTEKKILKKFVKRMRMKYMKGHKSISLSDILNLEAGLNAKSQKKDIVKAQPLKTPTSKEIPRHLPDINDTNFKEILKAGSHRPRKQKKRIKTEKLNDIPDVPDTDYSVFKEILKKTNRKPRKHKKRIRSEKSKDISDVVDTNDDNFKEILKEVFGLVRRHKKRIKTEKSNDIPSVPSTNDDNLKQILNDVFSLAKKHKKRLKAEKSKDFPDVPDTKDDKFREILKEVFRLVRKHKKRMKAEKSKDIPDVPDTKDNNVNKILEEVFHLARKHKKRIKTEKSKDIADVPDDPDTNDFKEKMKKRFRYSRKHKKRFKDEELGDEEYDSAIATALQTELRRRNKHKKHSNILDNIEDHSSHERTSQKRFRKMRKKQLKSHPLKTKSSTVIVVKKGFRIGSRHKMDSRPDQLDDSLDTSSEELLPKKTLPAGKKRKRLLKTPQKELSYDKGSSEGSSKKRLHVGFRHRRDSSKLPRPSLADDRSMRRGSAKFKNNAEKDDNKMNGSMAASNKKKSTGTTSFFSFKDRKVMNLKLYQNIVSDREGEPRAGLELMDTLYYSLNEKYREVQELIHDVIMGPTLLDVMEDRQSIINTVVKHYMWKNMAGVYENLKSVAMSESEIYNIIKEQYLNYIREIVKDEINKGAKLKESKILATKRASRDLTKSSLMGETSHNSNSALLKYKDRYIRRQGSAFESSGSVDEEMFEVMEHMEDRYTRVSLQAIYAYHNALFKNAGKFNLDEKLRRISSKCRVDSTAKKKIVPKQRKQFFSTERLYYKPRKTCRQQQAEWATQQEERAEMIFKPEPKPTTDPKCKRCGNDVPKLQCTPKGSRVVLTSLSLCSIVACAKNRELMRFTSDICQYCGFVHNEQSKCQLLEYASEPNTMFKQLQLIRNVADCVKGHDQVTLKEGVQEVCPRDTKDPCC